MPIDSFPSAEEAALLPLDQLALRLLALIREEELGGTKPQIRGWVSAGKWHPHVAASAMAPFLLLLQEAWDWLVHAGLIGRDEPSQTYGMGWTFVTRRGLAVLEDGGYARLNAEARLGVDLHPRIATRIRPQFLLGEYELAAFAALREVEIRVRELSKASGSLLGTKLMTHAFNDRGPLFNESLDGGESVAQMNLFMGAIGLFKNPTSHRAVEYADPTEASEVILLADLLLRLLDKEEARRGEGSE